MLPIAGQTTGPNELNFFWTLMVGRGCFKLKNIRNLFLKYFSASLVYFLNINKINKM